MNTKAAALAGALVGASAWGSKHKPRPNYFRATAKLEKSRRKTAKRSRAVNRRGRK